VPFESRIFARTCPVIFLVVVSKGNNRLREFLLQFLEFGMNYSDLKLMFRLIGEDRGVDYKGRRQTNMS